MTKMKPSPPPFQPQSFQIVLRKMANYWTDLSEKQKDVLAIMAAGV